jgi:hypothetical protein
MYICGFLGSEGLVANPFFLEVLVAWYGLLRTNAVYIVNNENPYIDAVLACLQ